MGGKSNFAWCGDMPLKNSFPPRFSFVIDKEAWVADVLEVVVNESFGTLASQYIFNIRNWIVFETLLRWLYKMRRPSEEEDRLVWEADKNENFSVKLFYFN